MNSSSYQRLIWAIGLIVLALISRIVPHAYNFSPMGAIALFGAAQFGRSKATFAIPLIAAFVSDLAINNVVYAHLFPTFTWFYPGFYWQYFAYVFIAFLGMLIFKSKITLLNIGGGALMSSLLFFSISNFGAWIGNPLYAQNAEGLLESYAAGLPFFQHTLAGDFVYSVLLFGIFYVVDSRVLCSGKFMQRYRWI